jgi:tricorn protease-like protein
MHRTLFFCVVTALFLQEPLAPRPAFAEPAISPDRAEIAFRSGGDIWTVPSAGGEARLPVSNAANDTRPVYSPDRRQLAFVSTRATPASDGTSSPSRYACCKSSTKSLRGFPGQPTRP